MTENSGEVHADRPPAGRRSRPSITLVLTAVIALLLAGNAAALAIAPKSGPSYPKGWDPRVADIAAFVQQKRNLTFRHPVAVDFLDAKAYSALVRSSGGTTTAEETASQTEAEGVLRAVGLAPPTVDLAASAADLMDDGTLAFYDTKAKRVTVRGTELTTALRVTLSHELTHVLQDQHFDLEREFPTDGQDTVFRALAEGDADRIEEMYVEQLPEAEKTTFQGYRQTRSDDAKSTLSGVPSPLLALFAAPYILGDPLVEFLAEARGDSGVDDALRSPPVSEEAMFDPFVYLEGQGPQPVDPPALASREQKLDEGDFGAVAWFLMLAGHVDDRTAMRAVDGWGGDSYVAYRSKDKKTCVRLRFTGDTATDVDEMGAALDKWKAAFPAGAAIVVTRAGDGIDVQSCDAGAATPSPTVDLTSSLSIPAIRTTFATGMLEENVPEPIARCAAAKLVAAYTTAQLLADELPKGAPDPAKVGAQAGAACRNAK
jgi:hypothetical protein